MPYLQGTIGERITDLRESRGWTKAELAEKIGVDPSRIGRMESGETQKISDDVLLSLAKAFGVSTDFLLGLSDVAEPKNFSIAELGLSVEAAKKIYTGEIDADVLNMLLEHPNFGTLINKIAHFFKGTFAEGFAIQNQIYQMVSKIVTESNNENSNEIADNIKDARTPIYQADLSMIQNGFMGILKDIKKKTDNDFSHSKELTQKTFDEIRANLVKNGGSLSYRRITAQSLADAVVSSMDKFDGVTKEMKDNLRNALLPFFMKPQRGKHK